MTEQLKQIVVFIDDELQSVITKNYTFSLRIKSNLEYNMIQNLFNIKYIKITDISYREIRDGDIFIFNKSQYFLSSVSLMIKVLKSLNKKIIFDLDDYCLELPSYSFSQHLNAGNRLNYFIKNLRQSDLITVSTSFLKEQLLKYNNSIEVIENTLNPEFLKSNHTNEGVIRILITSNDNLKINTFKMDFLRCLGDVKLKYGDRIEFVFLGKFVNINNITQISDKIYDRLPPEEYNSFLCKNDFHIGLVPLGGPEDPDTYISHSCKSNIKFLEFASFGIAGIYSNVEPYKNILNRSEGIIVNNTYEEWYNALTELIDKKDLRDIIIKNSVKKFREMYSKDISGKKWYGALKSVAAADKLNLPESSRMHLVIFVNLKLIRFLFFINKLWQKILFVIMLVRRREFKEIKQRIPVFKNF